LEKIYFCYEKETDEGLKKKKGINVNYFKIIFVRLLADAAIVMSLSWLGLVL